MRKIYLFILGFVVASCTASQAPVATTPASGAGAASTTKDIAGFTSGMEKYEGFFPFYWDSKKGKVYLEVNKLNFEFLYISSLPAGIGSNDIGLDRGQLGGEKVVKFVRSGPKILMIQPNYDYRAISDDALERKSVEQAFAQSAIWGFDVLAEEDWSALVDFTDFLLRDSHGVSQRLSRAKQGNYSLDKSRSMIYTEMTKNFPENSEFEATITFTGTPAGAWIRSVVPSPEAVTVRMHHSMVQLPDSRFKTRVFDPRSGYYGTTYMDYATPIDEPITKRTINRHRLEKVDPNAAVSEAVEPIIYYLDPGTPEPIRSALLEGAAWWNQAFEAAGYKDAFQVKMLPEDVDPMDVRYNLIQWIHRSTRGWSYGASVADPRTGEIIKGHVSLGSLRARQDFLIAEGLLSPYEDGKPVSDEMMKMVLARIRQLSAHEVGHTLGIVHSYASSVNNRASVMDYPHPYVKMDANGNIDLSEAYAVGIGELDKQIIKYGYSDFPDGTDEAAALDKIIKETFSKGLMHITDQDSRPVGGAHPYSHLWDNGTDAADELNRMMAVRRKILDNFSEKTIRPDAPMALIEEALAPMYLFHRYQVDATSKVVGGLNYNYALKGDGQFTTKYLEPAMQMKAFDALLATMTPEALALPEKLIQQIPPRPYGYPRTRETFEARTGVAFDPLSAAETAADLTLSYLVHPERATRLVEHHARNAAQPDFSSLLSKLTASTWKKAHPAGYHGEIMRTVDKLVMYHLMNLSINTDASDQARAITYLQLKDLKSWIDAKVKSESDSDQKAHLTMASAQLGLFFEKPEIIKEYYKETKAPDGSPIGMDEGMACGF
ncbi:MAG: zinc-dependent metalloprotease [Imperialibacter sp.]|uniref:zinc-dependent metalloprotease n=1 Tax=Imperialibacter sp. TaxID=2038411 RepID=UPI0032EF48A2